MRVHLLWLHTPDGNIRISTVLMGLAILGVVSWRTRRPLAAGAAAMGWICAYEIAWQGAGTLLHHTHDWATMAWFTAALIAWPLLSLAIAGRPDWRLGALAAAIFAVWMLVGFHANDADRPPYVWSDELLNEGSKTALGFAYLVGALRAGQRHVEAGPKALDVDLAVGLAGDGRAGQLDADGVPAPRAAGVAGDRGRDAVTERP
ncbi:MAG TPA: hypothetical protein VJ739_18170 [Gemmataceae bacterium]|nr:hypothetical protein [Gemmataceae bacterium]